MTKFSEIVQEHAELHVRPSFADFALCATVIEDFAMDVRNHRRIYEWCDELWEKMERVQRRHEQKRERSGT